MRYLSYNWREEADDGEHSILDWLLAGLWDEATNAYSRGSTPLV